MTHFSTLSLIFFLFRLAAVNIVDANEFSVLKVIGDTPQSRTFDRFTSSYVKNYESVEHMKLRFSIFSENLKMIRSHNKKNLSYTLTVNEYADWTFEEFRKRKLGAPQNCSATINGNHILTEDDIPESRDWRAEGIVSRIKNQGDCGSCWAFSANAALETAYAQAFGKNISLSEQQLVDCATAFKNNGCNGGLPSQAFEYIKYNGGLETDKSYPYTEKDGKCKFRKSNVAVKVIDSVNITQYAEDELKHAVGLVRPVSVAFHVNDDFNFYDSGVYTSTKCGSTPQDVDHAVLAVGYGVKNGMPYWIIKNSWGASWGEKGYFKMEMGKNMCGISTCASYPVVAEVF